MQKNQPVPILPVLYEKCATQLHKRVNVRPRSFGEAMTVLVSLWLMCYIHFCHKLVHGICISLKLHLFTLFWIFIYFNFKLLHNKSEKRKIRDCYDIRNNWHVILNLKNVCQYIIYHLCWLHFSLSRFHVKARPVRAT